MDVPNANTIFINDAQNFGLADLHQMRGRVGRSNRKAFCYLIAPPISVLTNEARKRLQAIEQFSDLGSGFNIAMKDLEIRGAGNLLGGEQTGFMMEIGFETYQKILNEAIEELKSSDFKDLFEEENQNMMVEYVTEVQVDTDLEILIPDDYVNNVEERLALYNQLTDVKNEEELNTFERNLVDRFGAYPTEVESLLESIRLKWLAKELGFEKIVLKNGKLTGYFVNKPQGDFFQSDKFRTILNYVQSNPQNLNFKEKPAKNSGELPSLMLKIANVKNVSIALKHFENMVNY